MRKTFLPQVFLILSILISATLVVGAIFIFKNAADFPRILKANTTPPPTCKTFVAQPNAIQLGQNFQLQWEAYDASSVLINGNGVAPNAQGYSPMGNMNVIPTQAGNHQYSLTPKSGQFTTGTPCYVTVSVSSSAGSGGSSGGGGGGTTGGTDTGDGSGGGSTSTGENYTYAQSGVFFTPNTGSPVKTLQLAVPNGRYDKAHLKMDVKHGGWYSGNSSATHNLFWFVIQRNFNMIGYLNAKGPGANEVFLRHGIGVKNGEKARNAQGVQLQPGKTYHVDYLYDTAANVVRLTITDKATQQTVVNLQDVPNVESIYVSAAEQPVRIDIGFPDPATGSSNQNEVPTYGWEYSNLMVDFTGGDSGQCAAASCNIGKKNGAYANCSVRTETVPTGERCTFTGFIQNHGPNADPNPTLYIEGNNCSKTSIPFNVCGQTEVSVECDAGNVLFHTNDGAYLEVNKTCGDGNTPPPQQCQQDSDCTEPICQGSQLCAPECNSTGQCVASSSCETVMGQCGVTNPISVSIPSQTISIGEKPQNVTISGGTPSYSVALDAGGTGLTATFNAQQSRVEFQNAATAAGTARLTITDSGGQTLTFEVIVRRRLDQGSIQSFSINSLCDGQTKKAGDICTLNAVVTFYDGTTQDVSSMVTWRGYQNIGELLPESSDLRIKSVQTGQSGQVPTANITALLQVSTDPVTEISNDDAPIIIRAVNPEELVSFTISSPCEGQQKTVGDSCVLRATGTFADGSQQDISGIVNWLVDSAIGTITNSVLQITNRPNAQQTTVTVTATMAGGANGGNIPAQNIITFQLVEKVPEIVSVETLGNAGISKGTTETLYIRVISEEGLETISDMEVVLLQGSYTNPDAIPAAAPRYQLTPAAPPETAMEDVTVLVTVPVLIPDYQDMQQGNYTFLVRVHTTAGTIIQKTAPTYLGFPANGDADLNGKFELIDIILMMKMANGSVQPSQQQIKRADFNGNGRVDTVDVIQAIQRFFQNS